VVSWAQLELIIETARHGQRPAAAAAKLVKQDKVDVLFGGIFSSTRQAIKGPAVEQGRTLYIYPSVRGQNITRALLHRPVPAQQSSPFAWLMREDRREESLHAVGDYVWPRVSISAPTRSWRRTRLDRRRGLFSLIIPTIARRSTAS